MRTGDLIVTRTPLFLREAVVSARAQPVISLLTIFLVAAMCLAVALTSGRLAGSQQQIVDRLDAAGTRTIVIRANTAAGVNSSAIARLTRVSGVQWAGGFGPAVDVSNTALRGGDPVALRTAVASSWDVLGQPPDYAPIPGRSVLASNAALHRLQLATPDGAVYDPETTADFSIAGTFRTPDFLRFLEPTVLEPIDADSTAPIPLTTVVIVARDPALVEALTTITPALLGADDTSHLEVASSEDLANLRQLIDAQLSASAQSVVAAIFAITALLIAVVMFALVLLRRRDFGRRRALGATRGYVLGLVVLQVALLAGAGAALGSAGSVIALTVIGAPLPSPAFFVATAILATSTAALAATLPGLFAASRDPLRELRVP